MKELYVNCDICGNGSRYDEESLKGSTWNINGIKITLCCPCEDALKKRLNINEVKDLKAWLKRFEHLLGHDDTDDLNYVINKLQANYN